MHRYLALIGNPDDAQSIAALRHIDGKIRRRSAEWVVAYQSESVLVVHAGSRPRHVEAYELPADGGVILGTLFRRESTGRAAFSDHDRDRIVATGGRYLLEHYWGTYVAVLNDRENSACHILRDPTANLACYHTRWNGVEVVFSDIEDCAAVVPIRFSINVTSLVAHLLTGRLLSRATGVNEVEDVPGGERLTISRGSLTRTTLWNPAEYCRAADLDDPRRAASELRSSVQTVIDAWAARCDTILHNLSGGLDSSIVAGCLAWTPSRPHVTCLNLHSAITRFEEPFTIPTLDAQDVAKLRRVATDTDERPFARSVANRWGFPLIEHERVAPLIELSKVWRAPLATKPSSYANVIDIDQLELQIVREIEADAVFNGLAGDSVFYVSSQPIGFVDYVWRNGVATGAAREAWSAAALSRESIWSVSRKAWRHGLLRRPFPVRNPPRRQPHLMVDDLVSTVQDSDIQHPWELLTSDLAPGKQIHVRGLVGSLFYEFAFERERHAPSVAPLAAQPVVETCLRIPTYTLLAGGVSRGLARRAFHHLLPLEVSRRIHKANGTPFYQRLARINMDFLRESLLDGLLVNDGVLDRAKLESYLVPDQRFMTVSSLQLLAYLSAEAWLRQWRAAQKNAVAMFGRVSA